MTYINNQIIYFFILSGIIASSLAHNDPRQLDKDNDGLISRTEFQLIDDHQLRRNDLNGDGVISQEEVLLFQKKADRRDERLKAKRRDIAKKRFIEIDVNGDDTITIEEAEDHEFSRLDKNGDGYVSLEEMRKQKGSRKHRRDYQESDLKKGSGSYK
ncbi:MAG: hypothetical protein CBB61_006890 [Gammaproteobacteria bacterium TMED1]|nr:MAG: hypothetical protein CBB61_006890 [Gammaproteobacteria bacterium TMED1]|tara:strand:- start:6449 stop:6919 length:471 start_codon:yes stop_codon:yes gene_type:complete